MTENEKLLLVCDDTNNVDFAEIDLSSIPPEILKKIDKAIEAVKEADCVAA